MTSADIDIGYYGSAAIVLLSDGENTSGPDAEAVAQLASTAGVHIYPIGIGSTQGTVLQIDGFSVATALDEQTLKQIAAVTNGTYYNAKDSATLAQIYRNIDLRTVTDPQGDRGDGTVRRSRHAPAARRWRDVDAVVRKVGVAMSFATPARAARTADRTAAARRLPVATTPQAQERCSLLEHRSDPPGDPEAIALASPCSVPHCSSPPSPC